jgi:stringent starvation protein B
MQPPSTPGSKRDALLALLDQGMVMMHLDARRAGVEVPSYLGHEAHLRLNLSYRFLLNDLLIDDWGVGATLSFRGQPFPCRIPWGALFALTRSGTVEGWLWQEDLPPELAATTSESTDVGLAPVEPESPRPRLQEVPLDDTSGVGPVPTVAPQPPQSGAEGEGDGRDPPPSLPHLRLVK